MQELFIGGGPCTRKVYKLCGSEERESLRQSEREIDRETKQTGCTVDRGSPYQTDEYGNISLLLFLLFVKRRSDHARAAPSVRLSLPPFFSDSFFLTPVATKLSLVYCHHSVESKIV
jgi:hypothetical protein